MPIKIVLITGMPRSGTTPIGERFATGLRTMELYEPLNTITGDRQIQNQFEMINDDFTADDLRHFIGRIKSKSLETRRPSGGKKRRSILFNRTRRTNFCYKANPFVSTVIWKDPFAVFLTPFITETHDITAIVTIRSPLSIMASFKRMGWYIDHIGLHERAKSSTYLKADIDPTTFKPKSPETAIYLWLLIYQNVEAWIAEGRHIVLIDSTTNLSHPDPLGKYLQDHCRVEVKSAPSLGNGAIGEQQLKNQAHVRARSRDSVTNLWRTQLSEREIQLCRQHSQNLWARLSEICVSFDPTHDQK